MATSRSKKIEDQEVDFEDIPFVYSNTLVPALSDEQVALIAASLASIFPAPPKARLWDAHSRLQSLQRGGVTR